MSIFRKPYWSFWGWIVGFIGLGITIWLIFFRPQEKVDLKLIIEDEFSIIELKEKIPDLKVLYKSEDITQQNKEIKVLIYSFVNEGKTILQNHYDQNKPFGLKFEDSEILSTKIIASNDKYLEEDFLLELPKDKEEEKIEEKVESPSEVHFKKMIIDSNKKITLKTYLIQAKEIEKTNILFLGKIAGIDKLPIKFKKEETKKEHNYLPIIIGIAMGIMVSIFIIFISEIKRRRKFEKVY